MLIVGSGFFTHNLRALSSDGRITSVMAEFDDWGRRALEAQDLDALLDFEEKAPAGGSPTPGPSTSPRCSSPSVPPRVNWAASAP